MLATVYVEASDDSDIIGFCLKCSLCVLVSVNVRIFSVFCYILYYLNVFQATI